jgi:acetylornithine deacetylase
MSQPLIGDLDPVALTAELVAINSVNPSLIPGAAGESSIADACSAWLQRHGFEVHRLESIPGRPSIVGIVRGTGGGKSLMLNGHYDTVTLAGYNGNPLEPRVENGRLHGRGAFDMKSGVAAMMVAAARATASPLSGDVLVCCVADEEHSSAGTAEVLAHFTADAGIVTEPMLLQPCPSHKGFVWLDVIIHGRAAHGSRYDLGIDAIAKAGHFLVALDAWARHLMRQPGHPQLGPGSIHASIIQGGEEASSYPASCRITIERRTIPGETAESVLAELTAILDRLATTVEDFRYSLEPGLVRQPFEADPSSEIVQSVLRHAEAVLGHAPEIRAEPFWTDASLLDQAGISCLLFGAAGEGAHAATEWVDIESIHQTTDIFTAVIRDFCGEAEQ